MISLSAHQQQELEGLGLTAADMGRLETIATAYPRVKPDDLVAYVRYFDGDLEAVDDQLSKLAPDAKKVRVSYDLLPNGRVVNYIEEPIE